MRVGDLMTRQVETVHPSESAEVAWRRLQSARINHLVVIDNTLVVGVISTKDLSAVRASGRHAHTVAELMSRGAVSASPTTTLRRAADLMRGLSIGCLPVLDNKNLVGIIAIEDLLDWISAHRDPTAMQAQRKATRSSWPRPLGRGEGAAARL